LCTLTDLFEAAYRGQGADSTCVIGASGDISRVSP
jgi:hypothetical protein